jgi:hypothetical protein
MVAGWGLRYILLMDTLTPEAADDLGKKVVAAAGPGWSHDAEQFNGPGGRKLVLQFRREGWTGTAMTPGKFERENYNVHAEINLGRDGDWILAVHFETEPYMTAGLEKLGGYEDFQAMRETFRRDVHKAIETGSAWAPTNYKLQVCRFKTGLPAGSTVDEMVPMLATALVEIYPVVDDALGAARRAE